MAKQLSMNKNPEKRFVNNSSERMVGIQLSLDQISKAEPFQSLYAIKPEVLEAIKADMEAKGFDPSKPVNVWKNSDGRRILIDGYTRVTAAEELGLFYVTAYETNFRDEAEAIAYAIHTQRDRRNLSDAELLNVIKVVDKPQSGFKAPITLSGGIGEKPKSTAEITAQEVGTSARKVERARQVLADPVESKAVISGKKSINQAALDIKAKRQQSSITPSGGNDKPVSSKVAPYTVLAIHELASSHGNTTLTNIRELLFEMHKDKLLPLEVFNTLLSTIEEVLE